MMSARSVIILVLALLFGGSAAVGVNLLRLRPGMANPKVDTVPVVVAIADVPRGQLLTATLVKVRQVPKDQAPPGALSRVEDAINRTVKNPLFQGDTLVDAKLTPPGSSRGLSALVPKGMRAVAIRVPDVATGVAGFIQPENFVDVLLTVNQTAQNEDETGGASTTTLLQHVRILAVDQIVDAPANNKVDPNQLRSVTLLVTPDQSNMIELGQNKGTLHLSLRNQDDDSEVKPKVATMADIQFHRDRPKKEPAPAPVVVKAPEPAPLPPLPPPAPEVKKVVIRTFRGLQEGPGITVLQTPADDSTGR